MTFEEYAVNHDNHQHCMGCGGCLLDPRIEALHIFPVWCVGCVQRIDAKMPAKARRPWAGGVIFTDPLSFAPSIKARS